VDKLLKYLEKKIQLIYIYVAFYNLFFLFLLYFDIRFHVLFDLYILKINIYTKIFFTLNAR